MKSYALMGLAAVAGVNALGADKEAKEAEKLAKEEKLTLQLEDFKGFYDGYYKAFYKTNSRDESQADCLNEDTISNMVSLSDMVHNPMALFEMKNIQADMNLFGEGAEVMQDLSACHFESSFFDLQAMCKTEAKPCEMSNITENLTKNMFVLMGKLTSMAETMKEFPSDDESEYQE